jgi:hypothetical protein
MDEASSIWEARMEGNKLVDSNSTFRNRRNRSSDYTFVQFFTFGSIVWVINGFIVFLPQLKPSKYAVNDVGGGWTAWLGATIFEFGAVTALFEAMNRYGMVQLSLITMLSSFRDDSVEFGGDHEGGDTSANDEERALKGQQSHDDKSTTKRKRKFIFFPYKKALWHEIGFWAAFSQFWAATIFWISGYVTYS